MHRNSNTLAIEVISIANCGKDGYQFNCIPKSHREEKLNNDIPIDYKEVKHLTVKQGQSTVFFDRLQHAGGAASECSSESYLERDEDLRGLFERAKASYPEMGEVTDISLETTLLHIGVGDSYYSRRGRTFALTQRADDEQSKKPFAEHLTKCSNSPYVKKSLMEARKRFIKNLLPSDNSTSRPKRKR